MSLPSTIRVLSYTARFLRGMSTVVAVRALHITNMLLVSASLPIGNSFCDKTFKLQFLGK